MNPLSYSYIINYLHQNIITEMNSKEQVSREVFHTLQMNDSTRFSASIFLISIDQYFFLKVF